MVVRFEHRSDVNEMLCAVDSTIWAMANLYRLI